MKSNYKLRMVKIFIFITLVFTIVSCFEDNSEKDPLGKACKSWFDCNVGELCINDHCLPREKHQCPKNECPKDMSCNTITNFCEAEPCTKHSDCPSIDSSKRYCDVTNNYCATHCMSDAVCGEKYICNEDGSCSLKPDENCVTKGCEADFICDEVSGLCTPKEQSGCTSKLMCEVDEKCNLETNKCEHDDMYCTAQTCPENYECDLTQNRCKSIGGDSCSSDLECDPDHCDPELKICVQCYNDNHCTEGTCNYNSKRCHTDEHCINDDDCPTGTKCISDSGIFAGMGGFTNPGQQQTSTCKEYTPCYKDTDCPEVDGKKQACKDAKEATETTDAEPGYCAKKSGNFDPSDFLEILGVCGCIEHIGCSDCPNGQECVGNKCYAEGNTPECQHDNECTELHPDETEPMICQRGNCIIDPTPRCTQESDCTRENMHNMHCDNSDGICYSCVTDTDCISNGSPNSTCNNHNCVNSSFCDGPGDCPDGEVCNANICRSLD